jgi:hypothetical protein
MHFQFLKTKKMPVSSGRASMDNLVAEGEVVARCLRHTPSVRF